MNRGRVVPLAPVSRARAGAVPPAPANDPQPASSGISMGAIALLLGGLVVVAYARRQSEADAERTRVAELEDEIAMLERNEAAQRQALYARPIAPPWGF